MIVRSKANEMLKDLFWEIVQSGSTKTTKYYYIGLSTTTPNPDGSNFTEPSIPEGAVDDEGNEITVNEYQRMSLEGIIGTPDNAIIKNDTIVFFNEAEHYSWGTITHFGIFTSKTATTPIFYGELTSPIQVPINYIPIFRAGKLQVGLDQDPANPE